jgi:hypothetical protein
VNWKIVKGKAGMHEGGKGKFVFLYDTSNLDFFLDTLVAGVTYGVIEQAGAWLGVRDPSDESKYLIRCQGKDAFIKALRDDIIEKSQAGDGNTYMNYIREACFRKVGIDIKYNGWT